MTDQLRNQRGADAYNAVCQLERQRNAEQDSLEVINAYLMGVTWGALLAIGCVLIAAENGWLA